MSKKITAMLFCSMLFSLMFLIPMDACSQEMAVPVNVQAALFKKIFCFDKTLQSKGNFELVILSGNESPEAVANAFRNIGVNTKTIKGNHPPAGTSVVYVMPGVSSPNRQCAQNNILSISGEISGVESGNVSIGLCIEGSKPKIVIHLGQLKAEGHEVSSQLLGIARLITQ